MPALLVLINTAFPQNIHGGALNPGAPLAFYCYPYDRNERLAGSLLRDGRSLQGIINHHRHRRCTSWRL